MKACINKKYGPPEKLLLADIDKPEPGGNEVLVRVGYTTVNRTDCAAIRAKPFIARFVTGFFAPRKQTPGTEFSGMIEKVGNNVTEIKAGDRVYGFNDIGAQSHAEYLVTETRYITTVPESVTLKQAAACSEGVHYALNFINKVNIQPGDSVLVMEQRALSVQLPFSCLKLWMLMSPRYVLGNTRRWLNRLGRAVSLTTCRLISPMTRIDTIMYSIR